MLVLLPFTFIEFFYAPWMRAQTAARAPRELPQSMRGHVILTNYGPLTTALIPMLKKVRSWLRRALSHAAGGARAGGAWHRVAVGDLDDPETYRRMRLDQAALMVTTRTDVINVNATFTARELSEEVPIVATGASETSRDVLELAGATMVLRQEEVMGSALARRVSIRDSDARVIGNLDDLLIAEASAFGTPLAGQTLGASGMRNRTGVGVIGVWNHGQLEVVDRDTLIQPEMIFILAGTREQIDRYNAAYANPQAAPPSVIIIGGGRVGRAASLALQEMHIKVTIIEKIAERVAAYPEAVIGDATHLDVLKRAHVREATTLIITTRGHAGSRGPVPGGSPSGEGAEPASLRSRVALIPATLQPSPFSLPHSSSDRSYRCSSGCPEMPCRSTLIPMMVTTIGMTRSTSSTGRWRRA